MRIKEKTMGTGNKMKPTLSPKERAKKNRKIAIILLAEVLVLAVLVLVFFTVDKVTGIQKVVINEADIEINDSVAENKSMIGYTNIALFGIDSRSGSLGTGNRSDTIMVLSINDENKEVKLVSVYRDTFLNRLDGTYNKINSAYSVDGPKQAINALNANLDLNITDYVSVGFRGLVDAIDALGGVMIDVDSAEITHLNNYMKCIAEDLDIAQTPVENTGYQLLNGLQATAYCRIRYTAGNDFKRTERQREVIMAMVDEAKTASASTLNDIADAVFPLVSTTLSIDEILKMISDVTEYQIIEQTGFPFATNITTAVIGSKGDSVIPLDLATNVSLLHKLLFNEENYIVSDTVQKYSDAIKQETAPYITGSSTEDIN